MYTNDVLQAYEMCMLCPNHCSVNRLRGEVGICAETDGVRVAWSGLHRGEEPPVTGEHGSGMIFFSGCPLHCAFCQNHQISGLQRGGEEPVGISISLEELSNLMIKLQELGATNINLVTGTHFIPSIIKALELAKAKGLILPIVWNSSGFESCEGLILLDPFVDLYLIDVKSLDREVSAVFCGLASYADHIRPVMDFLKERHPRVIVEEDGSLRGLLVRHLLFPGTIGATKEFLRYFAKELKDCAYLSLMVQFIPPFGDVTLPEITEKEYDALLALLDKLGIEDGFVQELGENISWIPDFTQDVPFPEGFADALPYFLELKYRNKEKILSHSQQRLS
ncbi:MAG: radical SAM protein [Sphaerochaeta sp.]|nr:radical SAM protein [Sphaerochaeta sp.]